jgi:large repetitive protein
MKKNLLLILLTTLTFGTFSFGQIVVTNTQAPNNLVQNVLLGNGVTATNITYNGSAVNAQTIQSNVSFFNAAGTTFPLASGVLLTTGVGTAAIGPNNSTSFTQGGTPSVSSDADLNAIAAGSVTNGAILEFDFVPSGDTVSFRYVFGSDEYPEFSPSSYNDAFGFFLSGPGLSGPYTNGAVNIALIPGTTTPVTINNVGDQSNTQYYVDNTNGAGYGTAIQYDGTTVVLTAVSQVQCGQTYHIKLAISNVGDQSYDSGFSLRRIPSLLMPWIFQ